MKGQILRQACFALFIYIWRDIYIYIGIDQSFLKQQRFDSYAPAVQTTDSAHQTPEHTLGHHYPTGSSFLFHTGLCPCYADPWHSQLAREAAGNCWWSLRRKQHNPRVAGRAGFNTYCVWKSPGVKAPKSAYITFSFFKVDLKNKTFFQLAFPNWQHAASWLRRDIVYTPATKDSPSTSICFNTRAINKKMYHSV